MAYIGVSPSNGVRQKHTYTATASQTSFSGAGAEGISLSYLDSNYVDVYQNGVKLSEADYTSTTGTTVVLATGATVSDMIEIIVYDVFSVADTVSKADGGTFDGNVAMAGTLGVTGVVTANAGVVVDEMTLDGDRLTATDTFTIDAVGDIFLDADGGDVILKDNDVEFGRLINDSTDFNIQCATQDKDIKFSGNDGGSGVNALILDMSDKGKAIFNTGLNIGDGTANNTPFDLAAANSGQDAIFIASSDETAGANVKGNSIGFAAPDGHTNRHASISAVQHGSDRDQVGLAFHVHTSATQTDAMVEAARFDSSAQLLVGCTSQAGGGTTTTGVTLGPGYLTVHRTNNASAFIGRSNDGEIVQFYENQDQIGVIGAYSDRIVIGANDTCLKFDAGNNSIMPFDVSTESNRDNAVDLGFSSVRFDDVFATNGTIQTSDRNEKQDIEELSDAEKRVAVVAKGLMRKFRWKDKVASKGDNARTHFGIIAQDLQDAFTAESLDASKYAMFCSNTWWEKEISVDAVEAKDEVKDSDGNVTSEAVEAKDAYTRIDTKEEATTGYTERTRLGVRYNQLLAFIISAI